MQATHLNLLFEYFIILFYSFANISRKLIYKINEKSFNPSIAAKL